MTGLWRRRCQGDERAGDKTRGGLVVRGGACVRWGGEMQIVGGVTSIKGVGGAPDAYKRRKRGKPGRVSGGSIAAG